MIEAEALTKRYGNTIAVDQLSFQVLPGQVTGFLGPNGSGKSTTMRMIVGLDSPDSGRVRVKGKRYRDLAWPLREVGALLEARAIHPGRSSANHLLALARANRIPAERVDEVLELVGLSAVARRRAGKLSLGMGQRLGIAAALLGDPGVLLFDEPVNGLDPDGIRWARNLLRSLAAEGRTVFVSSHLMSEMALTADHVIVVGRGRLMADLPIGELTARSLGFVRVKSPAPGALGDRLSAMGGVVSKVAGGALEVRGIRAEQVGEVAAELGVVLHELSPMEASLEEAYLELTGEAVEYRGGAGRGPDAADPTSVAQADVTAGEGARDG
ncbi:MAG: multidrug transporter ATP-binding protein [Acidimicrobiaceae bacterium]|nr:multidrug transporter ATP-binding protein [Acidimicrobiaceae bacterium]